MNKELSKQRTKDAAMVAMKEGRVGEDYVNRILEILEAQEEFEECAEVIRLRDMIREDL